MSKSVATGKIKEYLRLIKVCEIPDLYGNYRILKGMIEMAWFLDAISEQEYCRATNDANEVYGRRTGY
ncbi:MAG: hypothetical protein WC523_00020 [Patescibacteria group bacterium]